MFPEPSPRANELRQRLLAFMDEHIYPNEKAFDDPQPTADRWQPSPLLESLKTKAKAAGLWNLFLADPQVGSGLTNLEYAPPCEILGRSRRAPQAFHRSPPDPRHL